MNGDHIDHFCSAIQLLNEGGSKITEPNAGITSDMTGRWTIGAFDTSKKNKKETPAMKEAKLKKTQQPNVDDYYTKEQQEVMKKFGFEWGRFGGNTWNKYEKGGHFQYKTGLLKGRSGYKDSYDAELFLREDKSFALFIEYYQGGHREQDDEEWYYFKDFKELEKTFSQLFKDDHEDKIFDRPRR